jgi:holliday junction DNA helicase RuvA
MITFLKGKIIVKTGVSVIINVHDVGYQVFIGEKFLSGLKVGSEVDIYTYHHIKEASSDLYGFESFSDLEIFSLLLSVSGVGPKSALGILSISEGNDVSQAILRGDADLLIKVSGIGRKTAERIVLELKNKIGRLPANIGLKPEDSFIGSDEIDALMSLGYSLSEARNALLEVPLTIKDSGKRVKEALKKMKKV